MRTQLSVPLRERPSSAIQLMSNPYRRSPLVISETSLARLKYWEVIADKLSAAGRSWGLLQRRYPRWLALDR
jgi:hypothetical protein